MDGFGLRYSVLHRGDLPHLIAVIISRGVARRRGVSYILSVMVMAVVISTLAGAVMYWSLGLIGSAQSEYEAAISADIYRVRERFVLEHVVFNRHDSEVTVHVRNVGTVPVVIDTLYFNGTRILVNPPLQLGPSASGSFTVSTPLFTKGSLVYDAVASQRGNVVGAYFKVK